MKKFNLILLFIFIISCGSAEDVKKVLKNEKIRTTDEFLVKKKDPLELPPDYNNIPKPNSMGQKNNKKMKDEKSIREILKSSNEDNSNLNKSSSTEESILNQIRK